MEYELEIERDYIEFRKEMGEYIIEVVKNSDVLSFFELLESIKIIG